MPMTRTDRGRALNFLARILRAGGVKRGDAISRVTAKLGLDASDRGQLIYLYGQARSAVRAGDIARRTHNRTLLPSEIPSAPGRSDRQGQYRYEILVTTTDPRTGEQRTFPAYIYSADILSLDAVRDDVRMSQRQILRDYQTPRPGQANAPDPDVWATVVSVIRVV